MEARLVLHRGSEVIEAREASAITTEESQVDVELYWVTSSCLQPISLWKFLLSPGRSLEPSSHTSGELAGYQDTVFTRNVLVKVPEPMHERF